MSRFPRLQLARWLGPWAGTKVPPGVVQESERLHPRGEGERPLDVWVYRPRHGRVRGAYLVAPGLHYQGPADPRMDRFLRALARAGFLVYAPFLPDFLDLMVRETLIGDFARAFQGLMAHPDLPAGTRPGVFSISFGSLPALRLAADPRYADEVGALVVFGGYADFAGVVRFSLAGQGQGRPHDPLNRPVVLQNLLEWMDGVPEGPEPVLEAWDRYVKQVWGRPEMRQDRRYLEVAEREGAHLTGKHAWLYRVGVGLEPGALELCEGALARAGDAKAYLDPRPHLGGVRCPVHVLHGADDDVIPWEQMDLLLDALPAGAPRHRYLTGLYAHTGGAGVGGLAAQVREGLTLVRMLDGLVKASGR